MHRAARRLRVFLEPVLIKSIQELKAEIDALRAEIEVLKK